MDSLLISDQYKQRHWLPLFLSKITPPDSSIVEIKDQDLVRGVRTLAEVAHFVRCIPFKVHEDPKIWSSPDFLLNLKIGTIEEHALLMASMFRAVKFETVEDIYKKYKDKYKLKQASTIIVDEKLEDEEEEETKTPSFAQSKDKKTKRRKKKGKLEQEQNSLNDRVFVCLGKLKDSKKPHAWVMTLNP